MALLQTYGPGNMATDSMLSVVFTRRKIYGSWTATTGGMSETFASAWEYMRRATMSFRYVGMDEATAKDCADAMVTKYTRSTKVSEWDADEGSATFGQFKHVSGGDVPMAEVATQHDGGGMWSVTVSLNEEDSRTSLSASESFTSLFSAENSRTY